MLCFLHNLSRFHPGSLGIKPCDVAYTAKFNCDGWAAILTLSNLHVLLHKVSHLFGDRYFMSAGHFIVLDCQKATLKKVTAVTTYTCRQKFFSSVQTCGLVDVNQLLVNMVFKPWPRQDSFTVSRALGRICRRLSRFCNILLQDLTPLHVKITRSTNLLSACRRKLKVSMYLHTVSYNHLSFLNTCSQLIWILGSSGFYSITWRMISRNSFSKTASIKLFPLVGVISFVPLNFCSLANCPLLLCFHTIK